MQCSCSNSNRSYFILGRHRHLISRSFVKFAKSDLESSFESNSICHSSLGPYVQYVHRRALQRERALSFCKVSATGDVEGVLEGWNISGMGSSNKGNEEQDTSLDERESKRVKFDAPSIPQEQIVKVSGFGNRALRSVLKGGIGSQLCCWLELGRNCG